MADFIKLRLAAARMGVSMAFFALLAGIADRAGANPLVSGSDSGLLRQATTAAGAAGRPTTLLKLDSALLKLEHKLSTSFETTHKLNQTFLKIKSANTEFLKIKSANTTFLKIDDANAEFLKIDATAANAGELGGLSPSAFFQGNGHVVTGAVPAVSGTATQLLALPGGIIVVDVQNTPGVGLQLIVANGTGSALPAVQSLGGTASQLTLSAQSPTSIQLGNAAAQLHLQIFPSGQAFPDVVTIIISAEVPLSGGSPAVVGQAFTGGV